MATINSNPYITVLLGVACLVLSIIMYVLSPRINSRVRKTVGANRPFRFEQIQTKGGPLLLLLFGLVLIVGGLIHIL